MNTTEGAPAPLPPTTLLDLPLLFGELPLTISVAGLLGALFLGFRRDRVWWTRTAPAITAAVIAATVLMALLLNVWWQPFPDPLPVRLFVWVAVVLLALAAGGAHMVRTRWRHRLLTALAVTLVLATSSVKVNAIFGYFPDLRTVVGLTAPNEIAFAALPPPQLVSTRDGTAANTHSANTPSADAAATATVPPTARTWAPPPDMPASGKVTHVTIPATASRFPARQASIYLPPSYLTAARPKLPVLVLIPGAPGAPQDWLRAGRLATVMDQFAAIHRGLAPIVVLPDATGGTLANPLCVDSRLGNAETYLTRDVPDWVAANLVADLDKRHWAIGGFSYGGTCALQLAVRAPQLYPNFLDIAGQDEPSLGTHEHTVGQLFGGDEAAFRTINPLDILSSRRFDGVNGTVIIGQEDTPYIPGARKVTSAAEAAGMQIRYRELPGGHTWAVATTALRVALPEIATRMNLIASP